MCTTRFTPKSFVSALCCILAWAVLSLSSCLSKGEERETSAEKTSDYEDIVIHRGTNISHWLSQSDRRGEERASFFTREDIGLIDSLGYDHIRLPVDEEQLWTIDGEKDAEAFRLLHRALDWAGEAGLRVILDLHIVRSHHFNRDPKPLWTDPAAREQFLSLWKDLSEELGDYPNGFLAYEILNEAVADDPEDWNNLLRQAYRLIRQMEPERVLFIGSNRWQSTDTFDELWVPEGDPHIYLSFHFYHPMVVTHYRAGWTKVGEYEGPVSYPGQLVPEEEIARLPSDLAKAVLWADSGTFGQNTMRELIQEPLRVASGAGLPLYCGEWGALPTLPPGDRLHWYRDLKEVLEQNQIAWAHWDYKGGFGIVDREGNLRQPLIDVLLHP